jgi:hypothetical protein
MKKNLLILGLIVFGFACSTATTRIVPRADGTAQAISNDYEEEGAYDDALKEAKKYCEKQGKQMAVVNEDKQYTGMNKTAKGALNTAAQVFGGIKNYQVNSKTTNSPADFEKRQQEQRKNDDMQRDTYLATHKQDDHKITITFKCM